MLIEVSRRDDLESVGYLLMYLLRGNLPWQGLKIKRPTERYRQIGIIKIKTPLEELCKGYPEEFEKYLKYTRNLQFREEPDYARCRKYFKKAAEKNNITLDGEWEWESLFILKNGDISKRKAPNSDASAANKRGRHPPSGANQLS